jgi:ligand-binding sensor domain-containing protein
MWLAGQGAVFFDGDTWATYTARDGLAGELVQAIATDSQGRTWFGTDGGLSIWNGDTFFNITAAQGLPSADIRTLAAVDDAMWIGSWGGGLYRFADNQLEVFNVENTGLPSDQIAAVTALPNGDLLLGTDQGLVRFADGAVTPVAAISAPVIAIAVIDGAAWVATADDGVFVQQGDGWTQITLADGLPAATITSVAATTDAVWLGGETGGLVAFER